MPNTATRLISLILLLQRKPNQKAAELAEALGVSVRTLHRYMGMLDELGIPIYSERGPQGGFSLVRGYKMPPMIFTPDEASVLWLGANMVADLWANLYDEAARSALAKLENILPAEQLAEVHWARKAMVTSSLQRTELAQYTPLLGTLRQAIRRLKRVHLTYQGNANTGATTREVDPYALAFRQGWWYMIGFCHLRGSVRVFRVDRIQHLAVQDASFQIPEGFDAREYLEFEFQPTAPVAIRLCFRPDFAYLALNTPARWESMSRAEDGSAIVTITLPDLVMAGVFTMSYGPAVTALEPEALRRLLADWSKQITALYEP